MRRTDDRYARGADGSMEVEEYAGVHRRGRGFGPDAAMDDTDGVRADGFERLEGGAGRRDEYDEHAARSVEGWIIVVANVHEEATEDDVMDVFMDFGKVKDMHLNLDRRTGYVKGYALIQYEAQEEARAAIDACRDGLTLLDQRLEADYAFVQPPQGAQWGARSRGGRGRARSRSPMRD
ncbi:hypothetical protein MSPP1_000084 [Malassezia sp. CBS 17886]|nr:hypothetical protein MSPP1_000084 [Malassezia sp. CBS 17886]